MLSALKIVAILASVIIGALFIYGRVVVHQIEAKWPPAGTFVEIDGIKLHVFDKGQGPTVVLIHGASGNLHDFTSSIVDKLAETHRVLAFDRPGFGYSERPAGAWCGPDCQARLIHAAAVKLAPGKAVVLGHSWGGAVAIAYGLDYPDDVQGILDLSGATSPWRSAPAWYNQVATMPVLGPVFVNLLVAPLGQFLIPPGIVGTFRPNEPTADYRNQGRVDLLLRGNVFSNNANDVINLKAFNEVQAARYSSLKPKLIIITGADEPVVPPKVHAQALKAELPAAELIELPGIGHMPHHIAPDQVIAGIERLWQSTP
jgi:pimeloyl-ACP methyl ester carboxylesterase